jgi:hypothetical protein
VSGMGGLGMGCGMKEVSGMGGLGVGVWINRTQGPR